MLFSIHGYVVNWLLEYCYLKIDLKFSFMKSKKLAQFNGRNLPKYVAILSILTIKNCSHLRNCRWKAKNCYPNSCILFFQQEKMLPIYNFLKSIFGIWKIDSNGLAESKYGSNSSDGSPRWSRISQNQISNGPSKCLIGAPIC